MGLAVKLVLWLRESVVEQEADIPRYCRNMWRNAMTDRRNTAFKKSDASRYNNPITADQNSKILRLSADETVAAKNVSVQNDRSFNRMDPVAQKRSVSVMRLTEPVRAQSVNGLKSVKPALEVWPDVLFKGLGRSIIQKIYIKIIDLIARFQTAKDSGNPTVLFIISLIQNLFLFSMRMKRGIRKFSLKWQEICAFFEFYRKAFMLISVGALIITVCAVYAVNANIAYEYMYNGKVLGSVKNKNVVLSTVDLVSSKLSDAYGAEISIDPETDITFNRIFTKDENIDDTETVLRQLTYMKDMKVTGYVLVADGNELATFDSRDTADRLLDMVQQEFIDSPGNDKEYTDIGFSESISIKEIDTKLTNLQKPENILERVLTGNVKQRYHVVEKGETLSGIAKQNGIKTQEIIDMNPDIVPERLMIGQEVRLEMLEPLLNVQTKEVTVYTEKVPYDIVYENTSAMYKGEQTVKIAGTKGERQVTAEIIRKNGLETEKVEVSSVILQEPSSQVVLVGAKELPPIIGKGYFKYPTRGGRLTSRFGQRSGRMHYGIDLASSYGTPIYAADGGKVVSAGWNGSLGWAVVIDHGGNRETLYGHCSKLLVKAGDRVAQGQHIANVGNSGNSTGPHVHFEVHINGVPQNPLNYL